jgi:hypothetical protein
MHRPFHLLSDLDPTTLRCVFDALGCYRPDISTAALVALARRAGVLLDDDPERAGQAVQIALAQLGDDRRWEHPPKSLVRDAQIQQALRDYQPRSCGQEPGQPGTLGYFSSTMMEAT